MHQPVTLSLKDSNVGPMMFLPNDIYVGRSIDLYGEFSSSEKVFFDFVAKGGAAVDVGANIGAHSVAMALRYAHVYSFEPQELIYRILAANLALYNNTTLYHSAVGEQEGILYLPRLDLVAPNNFGGVGKDSVELFKGAEIATTKTQIRTLDKVEKIQREDKIDLIKIDVEGMEKEVLLGAQATIDKFRPVLYVENDKPDKCEALVKVIYNLGYKAWWHITPLYNPENFSKNPNNVFPGLSSFNLICLPENHWLSLTNALECSPDNPGAPPGCVM